MTKRRNLKGVNKTASIAYRVKRTATPIVFEDDECYEEEEEERKEEKKQYQCKICEKVFRNEWVFQQHYESHIIKKKKCPYCNKKFRQENLAFHKKHCNKRVDDKEEDTKEEEQIKEEKSKVIKKVKFTIKQAKEGKNTIIPNSGNLITNYFKAIGNKDS